jgi:SAM-dependent methyltransferase
MQVEALPVVERTCPLCGSASSEALPQYSRLGWTTVQCAVCNFIFLNAAPRYEALSEDLAWSQQFQKEKKRRQRQQPLVSWLDTKTRWRLHIARDNEWEYICDKLDSGRVLDVGCGPKNGVPDRFTPYGIEIEKAAAETAAGLMSARGGDVVHAPALEGLARFEDGFFDGIIMRSYLEHEARPREVLAAAFGKLRPGGVIYVKVPNFATVNRMARGADWCGFRFPDHLNYFTIRSLRAMAEGLGYRFELRNNLTRYTNDNLHAFLLKPSLD